MFGNYAAVSGQVTIVLHFYRIKTNIREKKNGVCMCVFGNINKALISDVLIILFESKSHADIKNTD